ncbi:glycine/betaine ABC transporter permease, partial [Staphylococcus aureus]
MIDHIQISFIALWIATAIAVTLCILLTKSIPISEIVMYIAAILQHIQALSLLGLKIPLFVICRVPAIIALKVYALFPILKNKNHGIQEVDPSLIEETKGIGMK